VNEREAIQFILEELKEQRRADFDMYFEMRKNTTAQYDRFLDRLREIDEKERELNDSFPKPEPQMILPKPLRETVKDIFKQLPVPKSLDLSVADVRDERVMEEEAHERKSQVPAEEVAHYIVEYLKHADGSEPLRDIQYYVETEMNTQWSNFTEVMKRTMQLNPCIQRSKVRGYYIYKEDCK
jgi:hypothetical protein